MKAAEGRSPSDNGPLGLVRPVSQNEQRLLEPLASTQASTTCDLRWIYTTASGQVHENVRRFGREQGCVRCQ